MSSQRRFFVGLCAAQALCLAVGMALHHRFEQAVSLRSQQAPAENVENNVFVSECLSYLWICGMQSGVCWLLLRRQRESIRSRVEHAQPAPAHAKPEHKPLLTLYGATPTPGNHVTASPIANGPSDERPRKLRRSNGHLAIPFKPQHQR